MVFSSITFIYYFLPLVLVGYFLTPNRYKNYTLLISSMAFYYAGEPIFILLLLGTVLANYAFGLLIEKYHSDQKFNHSKRVLILAVTTNVLFLGIFKYANFFAENFSALLNVDLKWTSIALPIGISFYTFQIMSYVIDVYRGEVKAQKNPFYLGLYVSLFPQLIAGPIVRYQTIADEIESRSHSYEDFAYGVKRFTTGLIKKVVIANPLGELWNLTQQSDQPSVLLYWLGAVGFMLQIYYDFSAYSDMGIGMGRMFGFHFLENFNYPYVSRSITEFWQRWHMSLGTWFKDYLYIPLGGNRTTTVKWIRNIAIVWLTTGFWHGAQWNFLLWGACFGVILVLEKWLKVNQLPRAIAHLYTLTILLFSFVLFNSNSVADAGIYLSNMLGLNALPSMNAESIYYVDSYKVLLLIAILCATPLFKNAVLAFRAKQPSFHRVISNFEPLVLVSLLLVATGYIVDSSFNPFLYFRF